MLILLFKEPTVFSVNINLGVSFFYHWTQAAHISFKIFKGMFTFNFITIWVVLFSLRSLPGLTLGSTALMSWNPKSDYSGIKKFPRPGSK